MSWTLEKWQSLAGRYDKAQVREALARRGFSNVNFVDGKPACDMDNEELTLLVQSVMSGVPAKGRKEKDVKVVKKKRGK